MTPILFWLSATILLTALLWVPYILNSFAVRGIIESMGYREDLPPLSSWAIRAKKAHANAVENLVLFAPLALAHVHLQTDSSGVSTSCAVYFFARFAHWLGYVTKIPGTRTLGFMVGWGATIYLAVALLSTGR